jgi:hypothetical protein
MSVVEDLPTFWQTLHFSSSERLSVEGCHVVTTACRKSRSVRFGQPPMAVFISSFIKTVKLIQKLKRWDTETVW